MIRNYITRVGWLLFVISVTGSTLLSQGAVMTFQTQADPSSFINSARLFVELLVKRDFATAVSQFDETMKGAMPQAKLEETWNAVLTQAGAFKEAGKTRIEKRGAYTLVFVTCDFEKAPLDVRVVFDQSKRVAGLFFTPATNLNYVPPAYVKTGSFQEKEVTVGEGGAWPLPASLTVPAGPGPFPAVILVHGSGPQDRDETIGPNKPFKDLAWGLASKGIAVLRYEKRTRLHGSKLAATGAFTVKEEVVDDVLAGVELLRKTEGIDGKRIVVLGHSLGGMLVPRIGLLSSDITGLIALAGATRPLEDVIPQQLTYIFSLDGSISKDEQQQLDLTNEEVAKVKALKAEDKTSTTLILGVPASYWLDLRGYDPPQTAKGTKQPLLILQGERDYQVTMQDFKKWTDALGNKPSVTLKSYPALNHLFIAGTGRSSPAEYEQVGHIDSAVIDDIAAWINRLSSGGAGASGLRPTPQ